MTRTELLHAVEAFLRDTGMADRQLGMGALNDPAFVGGLREGREPREHTRKRVVEFMERTRRERASAGVVVEDRPKAARRAVV